MTTPQALTIGEMSKRTNYAAHRIQYLIKSRGITPAFRAGHADVYTEEDMARIVAELKAIDEAKTPAHQPKE